MLLVETLQKENEQLQSLRANPSNLCVCQDDQHCWISAMMSAESVTFGFFPESNDCADINQHELLQGAYCSILITLHRAWQF